MSASLAAPSIGWFARHELRLAWRDWAAMMGGGRRRRDGTIAVGLVIFAAGLHGLAYALLAPVLACGAPLDAGLLAMVSAGLALSSTMMLSQALESVTRAFYARDDLDLLLSSPASSRDMFVVRIVMICLSTALMSGLVLAPFVNVAAFVGGARWLSAYVGLLSASAIATAVSVLVTLVLFKTVGPKRTRLIAQVVAAVVGASFLIGIQIVAIVSFGTLSRFSVLNPTVLTAHAPAIDSWAWLPARAVSGEVAALLALVGIACAALAFAAWIGAARFAGLVLTAQGAAEAGAEPVSTRNAFRPRSTYGALIWKEWTLLVRDPWLISQTLMQILYLIPPALLLWIKFGHDAGIAVVLAPVVVAATGQLAGGLAWLTISGEDAPDLVATAPLSPFALTAAKVASVLVIIGTAVAPITLALAFVAPWGALVTGLGAVLSAACAILIQLWFGSQSKRSNFRRRQVASKTSTFCEAFASILSAATAALAAAGRPIAVIPAALVTLTMVIAWNLRLR